jgi:hypothetical protein
MTILWSLLAVLFVLAPTLIGVLVWTENPADSSQLRLNQSRHVSQRDTHPSA